jgi:hypothetical protein
LRRLANLGDRPIPCLYPVQEGVVRSLLDVVVAMVLTAFAPASAIAAVSPGATIVGTVTLTAADGRTWAGDGARVALTCGTDGATRTEVADDDGVFRFLNVPIDSCSIEAEVQGFYMQPIPVVMSDEQVVEVGLHLGVVPLRVGLNVGGTAPVREPRMRPRSCRPDAGPRRSAKRRER